MEVIGLEEGFDEFFEAFQELKAAFLQIAESKFDMSTAEGDLLATKLLFGFAAEIGVVNGYDREQFLELLGDCHDMARETMEKIKAEVDKKIAKA